ncbi:hypothetical protein LJK87_13470 [Paenibacillus sp. P25]|nr:hypothetical protein LJK87_13470 [Paenibacillus sp. P25]
MSNGQRNHPCIALWCGNNEIDTAWSHYDEQAGWGWKQQYTADLRERIWADYEAVFHRILPEAVEEYAPGTAYWPSSPMTGLTGDRTQHAHSSTTSGDIHYWGVWHAVEPFEKYNVHIGRFMSEYGFQSFPEYRSVRAYAEEKDLALESEVMLAHQKNGRGNQLIKQYMDMYLPGPKDFPSFLYLSQVLQAEAMKTAIEAHRRRKPFCMGSLYWQMNDCWPVASWAGMDYYGRWKALQYYAKRSFSDILLSIDGTSGGRIDFHLVSDLLSPVWGRLHIGLYSFTGGVLKELSVPVAVGANTAALVHSAGIQELLGPHDPASTVLYARLEQDGSILDSKEHYFTSVKAINLDVPVIQVTQTQTENGIRLTLETDVLAKQVWVSPETEGRFSDNFFDLIPGMAKSIEFHAFRAGDKSDIPADPGRITVSSMADYIQSPQ